MNSPSWHFLSPLKRCMSCSLCYAESAVRHCIRGPKAIFFHCFVCTSAKKLWILWFLSNTKNSIQPGVATFSRRRNSTCTLFHISAMPYRRVDMEEKLNLEKGKYFKTSFWKQTTSKLSDSLTSIKIIKTYIKEGRKNVCFLLTLLL